MKNTDDSHHKRKPSFTTTKSTLLAVSKDDWNTKEDSGKSMKNALYIIIAVRMSKSTSRAEVTSNIEKIKPIALGYTCYFLVM